MRPFLHGEAPEIHSDGDQRRDFTYIDDIVRATVLAADAEEGPAGLRKAVYVLGLDVGDLRERLTEAHS